MSRFDDGQRCFVRCKFGASDYFLVRRNNHLVILFSLVRYVPSTNGYVWHVSPMADQAYVQNCTVYWVPVDTLYDVLSILGTVDTVVPVL